MIGRSDRGTLMTMLRGKLARAVMREVRGGRGEGVRGIFGAALKRYCACSDDRVAGRYSAYPVNDGKLVRNFDTRGCEIRK